jgi:hypothetical protein
LLCGAGIIPEIGGGGLFFDFRGLCFFGCYVKDAP